jgi:arylsulfatase A-like enzyme
MSRLSALVFFSVTSLAAAAAPQRPNIVLFLVDDMGWQDTSVPFYHEVTPFNQRYRTPNMERLAAAGMKFTQAYAHCVCSPTRVSLMTGMNAARHRVTNWTLRKDAAPDAKHPGLTMPDWNVNGLSPRAGIQRTVHADPLPALLKDAGYHTIHVGKAHFGALGTPGEDPKNLGFEVNIGGHAAGGTGSFLGTQNFSGAWRNADRIWDVPGLEKYHGEDIFLTEALTLEALAAVERALPEKKPFFLYMSHYAVHVPFAIDARFYDRYKQMGLDDKEAMYSAMVEGMDKSLGDIVDFLEKRGLTKNTVILFMSDNGGICGSGRGGEPFTQNRPLSSGKGSAHEGGIRVPMIVKWPGVVRPASVCDVAVHIDDYFSSILDLAGLSGTKPRQIIDGISFVPLLRQVRGFPEDRPLYWHFPNQWGPKGPGLGPHSTVRKGDWKLIYYHSDRRYELFNLRQDIGETTNLADQQPERVRVYAAMLGSFLENVDAQMPADKQTGWPVPFPK